MSKSNVKATVVDDALIVSFSTEKEPRVWRMDMGKFLSTALEVKENEGKFTLVVKPGSAQQEEIGSFADKKSAVDALESITAAMLGGREAPAPQKTCGWFRKLLKFVFKLILVLLIAIIAITVWGRSHRPVNTGDVVTPPSVQTGVPEPADKVLGQ